MPRTFTLEVTVSDNWIEEGFKFTPQLLQDMSEGLIPYAYPSEVKIELKGEREAEETPLHKIPLGEKRRFEYPDYGTPDQYPDYTAHSGLIVTVVRPATLDEVEEECQPMYLIRATDGWEGFVNEDELKTP